MNLSVVQRQRSLFRKRILFYQILNLRLNFQIEQHQMKSKKVLIQQKIY